MKRTLTASTQSVTARGFWASPDVAEAAREGGGEAHMGFAVYMIGMLLVIGALAYGAHLLGVNETWIGIFAVVLLGMGVMGGIVRTRKQDPS